MKWDPYLAAWQERSERQRASNRAASVRALKTARELARTLAQRYGATRIVLVGSLARGEFGSGSDIDLAVEGVPAEHFFAAGAELERLAGEFKVDLVPLESANPFYLAQVAQTGVALT